MTRSIFATASALVFSVAALSGCASTPETGAMNDQTMVRVENHNPLLVTVDAVSAGEDYRLGQVETGDTEVFEVPAIADQFDLRILVDPLGSTDAYLSEPLNTSIGDVIEVRVEAEVDLTTVVVR